MVVCDGFGDTVFRNATAERHLGASSDAVLAEQAVGEALLLALQGDYPERTLELFAPSPRDLIIRAFPLAGLTQPDGAVAIVQDASDRHRLEAIRRDFVANVSHELKTPVGALEPAGGDPRRRGRSRGRRSAGEAGGGRSRAPGADHRRSARPVADRGQRVAPPGDGSAHRHRRPGGRAAASGRGQLRRAPRGRRPAPAPGRPGDRRDLVSAVSNLVDNAIKYSERGSLVQVRLHSEPGAVEIAVIDQGVGIPARDKERIFERFYRVDRARSRSTGGTGLGLSIVRHVAVNHSGSVRVDSREGEGSTFTLRLPARSLVAGGSIQEKPLWSVPSRHPVGPVEESTADSGLLTARTGGELPGIQALGEEVSVPEPLDASWSSRTRSRLSRRWSSA